MNLDRLEAERLGRMLGDVVGGRVDAETGRLLVPGAPSSFSVEFDETDEPVVRREPARPGFPLLGSRKALEELVRRGLSDPARLASPALRPPEPLQDPGYSQSVGPDGVKNRLLDLSAKWTSPARAAWTAAARAALPAEGAGGITVPAGCAAAQRAFGPDAEELVGRPVAVAWGRRAAIVASARAYDQACLAPVGSAPAELLPRLAAILSGPKPYCMAVRLRDDVFLTARHCLHREPGGTGLAPPRADQAAISLLTAPDRTHPFAEIDDPAILPAVAAYGTRDDLVLIRAKLPAADRSMPPVGFAAPRVAAPAYLVGLYAFHDIERLMPASPTAGPLPARGWALSLRATRVEGDPSRTYCRTYDWSVPDLAERGCLIHACQSVGGFSGSPVFARRADGTGWDLVAIHTSDASPSRLAKCERFASGKGFGVVGSEGALAALIPGRVKAAFGAGGR